MFKKIKIENFRGITELELSDFGQINLFVGKNNCGKTTVLESLFLLTAPTNPELPFKINRFRGLNQLDANFWLVLINKLDVNHNIRITGELQTSSEKRELEIIPAKEFMSATTSIDRDTIDIKIAGYSAPSPIVSGLVMNYTITDMKDSVMRKKNKRNMNTKSFVSKIIATEQGFHLKPPENYKESQRAIFIIRDHKFGDLAAMFNNIQIEKRVDRIVNILKKVEPSLTDLSLGTNRMIYCDIGLDKLMSINILGDGIIKLFSIISAISEMSGGGILLIDEIENGFHHETQKILWDSIFKAAKDFNVQIFATTHSIECVEAFSNAYYDSELEKDAIRLYRIEKEKDDFNVVIYDHKSLISSLEDNWEVR